MKDRINTDMVLAMKSGDKEKLATIRMVKSQMQLEEINQKKELTNDEVINIVIKQIKMRKDSIAEFIKGDRQDLVDKTLKEIDILNEYLPAQLTIEELHQIIDENIKKHNITNPNDFGRLMKEITPLVRGKADMALVSKIIKEKLN